MSLDIKRAMDWPDEMLSGMVREKATGRTLRADEVRKYLSFYYYEKRYQVLPIGECPNFNFHTGCQCDQKEETK